MLDEEKSHLLGDEENYGTNHDDDHNDENTECKTRSDSLVSDTGIAAIEAEHSSLTACLANLTLGVLGAGQLTLPYALKSSGLYLGTFWIIFLGFISMYVLTLITYCLRVTNTTTYGCMLEKSLGTFYKRLANLLLALYAWGGAVSFLVLMAGVLDDLAIQYREQLHDAHLYFTRASLISAVTLISVYPLALLHSLDRLKFTSVVGAFCAIFITIVVAVTAKWSSGGLVQCPNVARENTVEDLYVVTTSPVLANPASVEPVLDYFPTSVIDGINAIPLIAFALNSAWCYVNVYVKMDRNHCQKRVYTLIFGSHMMILLNYVTLAVIGYLSYCSTTQPNILNNMGTSVLETITRIILVIQLCFALPMRFHVTRGVIYQEIKALDRMSEQSKTKKYFLSFLVTSIVVGSALVIACLVSNLAAVIGLTSAICASFIIYIFPSLCYFKLKRVEGETVYAPLLVLFLGVFVFVGGVAAIIAMLASGREVVGG